MDPRTRLLLEAPIAPTLLRLAFPNVLVMLAQASVGLVAKMFGPANMAMLFGIVMLAHQVGGFLGAYLGGTIFEATGSYDWVWYIDIVLAAGAALVNLPIREAHLPSRAARAAA